MICLMRAAPKGIGEWGSRGDRLVALTCSIPTETPPERRQAGTYISPSRLQARSEDEQRSHLRAASTVVKDPNTRIQSPLRAASAAASNAAAIFPQSFSP